MKLFAEDVYSSRFRRVFEGAWQLFVLVLLAFSLLFYAAEVQAAKISFEPGSLEVAVAPGEMVSVPVSVSLSDTALPNSYASFGLAYVGGSLDRSWLNNQVYISLNSWYKTRQAILRLRIPENAQGGQYKGTLKTVWLRSNESVEPVELEINVEVDSFVGCSQAPLFSDIVSSQDSISARNHKDVVIELSGSVTAPEGCDIENGQYVVVDEYGELDLTENLTIDEDGSFSASVPLVASRKGNDKDGRLYTVKFVAENEAGIGESAETSIVVMHDNGKK